MLLGIIRFLIWLSAIGVLAVTILPLMNTHQWWIRMWDFPRLHIFAFACLLALVSILVQRSHSVPPVVILIACAAYQAKMILPFTPFVPVEIELGNGSDNPTVSFLAANVLMENEEYDRLIDLIEEENPDVLFLMETDNRWVEALENTLKRYPTVLSHPQDNHYGLIFASGLEVQSADTVYLANDNTPTLLAELRAPGGAGFHFIGLHPRPPIPGEDTDERDAQIKRAATLTKHSDLPVIAMGDFNDVAWSWTAQRFKHYGGFRDPRVGRGMLPSFDANHPILRFPIDQLYLTGEIELISFERKRNVGSDHFPMGAVVAVTSQKDG